MKFSFFAVAKGARDIREHKFTTLDGPEAKCGLRPLRAFHEALALSRAEEYAAARGTAKPVDGNPLYELGKAIHLVALACTDLDDPTGETPFFDGGPEQIEKGLDTERIFLLKEAHLAHQEESMPRRGTLTADEYVQAIYDCVAAEAGAELPFESWPLRTRRNFVRSMAIQLFNLLQLKSQPGSASVANMPAGNA